MFNSEPEVARAGFEVRLPGMVVGSVLLIACAAAMMASRAAPFYVMGVVAAFAVAELLWPPRSRQEMLPRPPAAFWLFALFGCYAAVSGIWSQDVWSSLGKAMTALAFLSAVAVVGGLVARRGPVALAHIGEGMWIGFVIALMFTAVELATEQGIVRGLVNALGLKPGDLRPAGFYHFKDGRLVSVSTDAISRNIAPLSLLLWPALTAIAAALPLRTGRIAGAIVLVAAIVVAFASPHESSKLAIVVGVATFAVTLTSLRWGARLLRVSWLAACLLPVPLALGMHAAELHKAEWLPLSARLRVEIWQQSASASLRAPIFGHGAVSTYVETKSAQEQGAKSSSIGALHQHNVYLQVWQELGVIGAVLLALAGMAVIGHMAQWQARVRPYAFALFASAAALAATSYGMWQYWYLAIFALSAIAMTVAKALRSNW